ncbi:hypothetical protein YUWDRAFT_01698 [Streptomyces sp. AmelKG-D3]|nr:hypothetical protein YUWDRAFT_01698 [Streptomyces sp. AmelKG-D3]
MAAPSALPAPTRRRALTVTLATAAAVVATPAGVAAASPAPATRPHPRPRPLRHAHAHNDYLHPRPLHDALAHGFTSVEADVFFVDGELLVAHEPAELDPRRTLAALYLEPLRALVRAGHGSVYPHHRTPFQLLIDIKADGVAAYRELDRRLTRHGSLFTRYHHGRVRPGAVTAVISGDRAARVPMEAQRTRLAFYDGRLDDLGTPAPPPSPPSSAPTGPRPSAGPASGPSPGPSATGSARSSPPPTARAAASASGPPPTCRDPPGRPSGANSWPPGPTTSTPTTWPDSNASCAPVRGRPGSRNTAGPGSTRSADTPVRRTAAPLRHTGGRMPQIRRGGGGWPWSFRSHWCCC